MLLLPKNIPDFAYFLTCNPKNNGPWIPASALNNFDEGCSRVFPGVLLVLAIKEGSLRLFKLGNI